MASYQNNINDKSRITWDEMFVEQSLLLAKRSTCSRLRVGAVIVRDNRVIAGGYNGSISNDAHCIEEGCRVVDGHCVRTVHAEINALLQCAKYGTPTIDTTIYVTHYPCLNCAKAIIQAGIKHVAYAEDYRNNNYVTELFKIAGITVSKIKGGK